MPTADSRIGHHRRDDRLAELRDVMPTLLDLCDIPIPGTVEGYSLVSNEQRDHLYCEHYEDERAMRMIRSEQYKLIWYPTGNRVQLFDLEKAQEMYISPISPICGCTRALTDLLIQNLYGRDLDWVKDGRLVGEPDKLFVSSPNRDLAGQRGWR